MRLPFIGRRCYGGVRLLDEPSIQNVQRIDRGVMPLLVHMEEQGLLVDREHFSKLRRTCDGKMEEIRDRIKAESGCLIDPAKDLDIVDLLFNKLKLKLGRVKLTKSRTRPSVDKNALSKWRKVHPVIPLLIEYSEVDKIRSTYCPIPSLVSEDGRLHPNIKYAVVETGRWSMEHPNLMGIPVRTELGREVRNGFVAPDGWSFVAVDQSQIELRWLAALSQCPSMLRAYREGLDLHTQTAARAFHIPEGEVNERQRYGAKRANFAIPYGITAEGLLDVFETEKAEGWTEALCQRLIDSIFAERPEIKGFIKQQHRRARAHKMVWSPFGRVRWVPEVHSANFWIVERGLRKAQNHSIQSGAQESMKLAMAFIWNLGRPFFKDSVKWLLQIHDDLLAYVRDDVAETYASFASWAMGQVVDIGVPIEAEAKVGKRWGDMRKLKT